jgi:Domain of unknown function (DUF2019)
MNAIIIIPRGNILEAKAGKRDEELAWMLLLKPSTETMKPLALEKLTVDQLVERFAEIGGAQDRALLYDERKKFNSLFSQMNEVDQELRSRGLDARLALLRLFDHDNMQVRLKAAVGTLAVAPETARKVLEAIRASKLQPQAMDAGMILRGLDDGEYKPD